MNIGSWIFGENNQDGNAPNNTSEAPPPPSSETLNAEEVRRRRLNNTQLTATSAPHISTEDDIKVALSLSPKRANIKLEPNNTTPQNNKKTKPPSSPTPSAELITPSPNTTPSGAKQDRYARTLNLALEFIFQITVRPDNARGNIKFMDTEGDSDFLNVDNLEYLLPMRLMEVVQEGVAGPQQGAPCYLIRAYRRLMEKEYQTLKEDAMHKDLQRSVNDTPAYLFYIFSNFLLLLAVKPRSRAFWLLL
jgi:hypothetical protein